MSAVLKERVHMRDESREAHAALEAWARWARSAYKGMGYSPTNIISRLIEFGPMGAAQSFGPVPTEADSTCELVEKAVNRLDETEREVIHRAYLHNEAAQVSAKECGLTYGYYKEVLSQAIQRIADYLAGASGNIDSRNAHRKNA